MTPVVDWDFRIAENSSRKIVYFHSTDCLEM